MSGKPGSTVELLNAFLNLLVHVSMIELSRIVDCLETDRLCNVSVSRVYMRKEISIHSEESFPKTKKLWMQEKYE